MRIRTLRLIAFGPFTDHQLRFYSDADAADALCIVYGDNEAGKSTALRAVAGLLFGIPAHTRDAHRHGMTDLRIGGELQAADGSIVDVVRRKGHKNTLVDAAGVAQDEALLRRLCGGATEASFRTLFGLDHEALRAGAEALLAGGGAVGESLFDAALGGGRGIHHLRAKLDAEADELFTPQAQKRKLNEAIRAFQDARTDMRDKARSGEAWVMQHEALDRAVARRAAHEDELRAAKKDLSRLERTRRLLPLAAKYNNLGARYKALGEVVLLPPDAGRAREAALAEQQQALGELRRQAGEIAIAEARRAALSVPGWLDQPAVVHLADVPGKLVDHRRGAEDRPRLAGLLAAAQAEATALAVSAWGTAAAEGPGEPGRRRRPGSRLGAAARARVGKLALEEAGLVMRFDRAVQAVVALEARRMARAEALTALPAVRDTEALRALLRRLDSDGDVEDRLDDARRRLTKGTADLKKRLASLGLPDCERGPAEVLALAPPSVEAVDRFATDFQARDARDEALGEEQVALDRERTALDRELALLRGGGDVPSLLALEAARAERAAAWTRLQAAWQAPASKQRAAMASLYELAQVRADEAADRLWREAERVARAATNQSARAHNEAGRLDLVQRRAAAAAIRAELDSAWRAAWAPCGVVPGNPDLMRMWLRRFGEVVDVAAQAETAARDVDQLASRAAQAHVQLTCAQDEGAVTQPGETGSRDGLRLGLRRDRAEAAARAIEEANRQRDGLTRELRELAEQQGEVQRERTLAEACLLAWRQEWAEAVAPLHLAAQATAAEATAVLEAAGLLASKEDEAAKHAAALASIDEAARSFEHVVRGLAASLAPELAGQPVAQIAEHLLAAQTEGSQARRERDGLDEDLRRRREAGKLAAEQGDVATAKLVRLCEAAGAPDTVALEQAELRSASARDIARAINECEEQILQAAEGLSVADALTDAVAAGDDVESAITSLRERVEDIESQLQRTNQELGSIKKGLEALDNADNVAAADAAGLAQGHLARVRAMAEEFARLKLAAHLLAREIERHRDRNQGPVVARAGELLARLTRGDYTGLRADLDENDRPVLRGVRLDGTKVPVSGLSDGSRDQLYLALRLASLEHTLHVAEPLPLILDDILIHFDDQRAAAALSVLADHARVTQVVLFTHHARIVELAQKTLPAARVRVARLDRVASPAATRRA